MRQLHTGDVSLNSLSISQDRVAANTCISCVLYIMIKKRIRKYSLVEVDREMCGVEW